MSRTSTYAADPGTPALYRKLRPRPNGPSRQEVKSNQRARLHGATIKAIAEHGYAATSVAELCRLAGVSKRTFYEQFRNKEACFLSTYDRVTTCAVERIVDTRPARVDWEMGTRAALTGFAHAVVEFPNAARLALLEALRAGPATLARRDRARLDIERVIASSLDSGTYGATMPVITGIVCGVERTMRVCLRNGRLGQVDQLAEELIEWALPYGSAALVGLSNLTPTRVHSSVPPAPRPRARHGSSHTRIVRAAAEIAAEDGYAQLTAAKIARRAGVSEGAFRSAYASPEECFLDALDRVCLEALLASVRAARTAEDPLVGMHRGVVALLECIALDPVLRNVAFVEVFAAGPDALECSERFIDRLMDLLSECLPSSRETPRIALQACSGALWGLLSRHALQGGTDLAGLAHHASYLVLAPLVGGEAAVRAIASGADELAEGVWETDRTVAPAV
ncbi:MAG TPA: TetR/AcrR family transcriptional regulator [Solirubrobacteraceae bacterium]|nr:TetR/AcrR family transcriptional regulator [Solirubrobacteraceae bacterium]